MLKTNKNDIFRLSLYGKGENNQDKIHSNYCPILFDDFITVCLDNTYKYWAEALEIINPYLFKRGIRIVAFSSGNVENTQTSLHINQISLRHAASLIERSRWHFSGQDWSLTLCQNNKYENYSFVLTGEREYLFEDKEDYIDDLEAPEKVAKLILEKLGIKEPINVKTLIIGPGYNSNILEMIPDFDLPGPPNVKNGTKIGIRCDLFENWQFVMNACRFGLNPTVLSKSLPPKQLCSFLTGVSAISLRVDENTDIEHVKEVQSFGIPLRFIYTGQNQERIKRLFFDLGDIRKPENWGTENLDKLSNFRYDTEIRSKKLIVSKDGTFLSIYHWKNNLPISKPKGNLLGEAVEDEEFLVEADNFYYYE